jgi:cytochrome c-type biogenesis protein CcmH/NrfG
MAPPTSTPHPLASRAVVGLEGSRKVADKKHRNKRVQQRITSSVVIAILMGVVAAAGYVGYEVYTQERADEQLERDRRLGEIEAERAGRTTDDLIDQLEDTPRWNGPGAPAFGVGEEPAGIEITDGNVGG